MKRFIFLLLLIISSDLIAEETRYALEDMLSKDIEELINIKVDTVVSASKSEERIMDAPGVITVFNRYQIEAFGCRTLADILNLVRSFYITYDYNYNYVGTRGLYLPGDYNSRILLLIDGHQVNDNIYDQAFIGTDFLLDVDLIERVEIIRGPVSSLYGGNAIFGVVNVITRKFKSSELTASYGTNDTYKGRLTLTHKSGDELELMGSGTYYSSLGSDLYFKELEARGYGDGRNYIGDYDRYPSLFAKVIAKDLTVFGGYIERTKGIPTGTWGIVYNDKRNKSIDRRGFLELKYDKNFMNKYNLMWRLFYDSYEYEGIYIYPDDIQSELDRGALFGAEIRAQIYDRTYRLNIGAELKDNFMQNMEIFSNNDGYILDFKHSSISSGFYIGFIYDILRNLKLNLSGRYDYFEYYDDAISARIALIYNYENKSVLKLIAGNSYRPPNIYERYYNDNNQTQKAPEHLNPEMIYQTELVYEQHFSDNLTLNASIFYSDIDNLIRFVVDPSDDLIVAKNADSVRLAGFEYRLAYGSLDGKIAGINYNYFYQIDDIPNSFPEHMVKLRGAYPVYKNKIIAGLSLNLISKVKTLSGSYVDPIYLLNLNLLYKNLFDRIDLSLGLYNLFNQRYYFPASVEHSMDAIKQEGINFLIKASGRF